jgi:hypothetical protein
MPRRLRVFVEGEIYHVHNRFASGEFSRRYESVDEDLIGKGGDSQ